MTGYALTTQKVPAYRVSPADGLPLPQLVDFQINPERTRLSLLVTADDRLYTKHIDLTQKRAGLTAVSKKGYAVFRRTERQEYDPHSDMTTCYPVGEFALTCAPDLMEMLTLHLWGRATRFAAQEGLHPVCPDANAAD